MPRQQVKTNVQESTRQSRQGRRGIAQFKDNRSLYYAGLKQNQEGVIKHQTVQRRNKSRIAKKSTPISNEAIQRRAYIAASGGRWNTTQGFESKHIRNELTAANSFAAGKNRVYKERNPEDVRQIVGLRKLGVGRKNTLILQNEFNDQIRTEDPNNWNGVGDWSDWRINLPHVDILEVIGNEELPEQPDGNGVHQRLTVRIQNGPGTVTLKGKHRQINHISASTSSGNWEESTHDVIRNTMQVSRSYTDHTGTKIHYQQEKESFFE